jgi:3-hydroxyisobutyrate dehydrogenase
VNYQLEKIGFIGLGVMGAWMCKNLLKAGYTVNVWNRTPSKMKEQISGGAVPCNSPKEVAEKSDIIIIMVGDGPDVEDVVFGPSGVMEGAVSGSVVIDMSSTLPAAERHVAAILEKKGIEMLDAPVSGGEVGAREAALSIMVGGHKETYEKCLPVLSVLGRKITYMGESGSGQATKLCNQVICALHIQAVCESLILGAKLGLDLERLLAVVTAGYANSRILEDLGPKMIKKDFKPGFRMRHQLKDLKNALATAATANLPMPCTSLTYQLFESVAAMGLQESGTQVSIQVMEKLAQYKLGKTQ